MADLTIQSDIKGAGLPEEAPAPSPRAILLRRTVTNVSFLLGAAVLVALIAAAFSAPWIAPHDPYHQSLEDRLIPPVWYDSGTPRHLLGTDNLGRDYLSRLLYGTRISLLIGISAMLLSAVIGTSLGIAAGYFGGRVDMLVSFLISVRLAMPVVLVAMAVVSLIGGSLEIVILVLGFLIWDRFAVVMRAATQQIRTSDYVKAARAVGCSTLRIVFREIFPNVMNKLIVVATLEMARAILLEAALSFLGLGVQPPLPSWGLMISEGRDYMLFMPWIITIPGVALFLLVLSINLMGDAVRDITAPENRA